MIRRDRMNITDIISEPDGFQDWMLLLLMASRCRFFHCRGTKTFWRKRPDSFHGRLRQLPRYRPYYRKLRKTALRNAIGKIITERKSLHRDRPYAESLRSGYWHAVISLLSAAERTAEVLSRRYYSKKLFPDVPHSCLENVMMPEEATFAVNQ
jgi:hypothetical protein